ALLLFVGQRERRFWLHRSGDGVGRRRPLRAGRRGRESDEAAEQCNAEDRAHWLPPLEVALAGKTPGWRDEFRPTAATPSPGDRWTQYVVVGTRAARRHARPRACTPRSKTRSSPSRPPSAPGCSPTSSAGCGGGEGFRADQRLAWERRTECAAR